LDPDGDRVAHEARILKWRMRLRRTQNSRSAGRPGISTLRSEFSVLALLEKELGSHTTFLGKVSRL